MLDVLNRLRGRKQASTRLCECRRCGATLTLLEVEDEHCPYCGPIEVVCYRFE